MITFTDKRLYVKGTCSAILSDKNTGDIVYFSDKFQTGNMTTSVTTGEIRAGLGNGIATIIPSDSALNVEFAAADFPAPFLSMARVIPFLLRGKLQALQPPAGKSTRCGTA